MKEMGAPTVITNFIILFDHHNIQNLNVTFYSFKQKNKWHRTCFIVFLGCFVISFTMKILIDKLSAGSRKLVLESKIMVLILNSIN